MQKRFTNFKDPVNSFPLGEMNVGLLKPGRYNGFNVKNNVVGLTVSIDHTDPKTVKKTILNGDYIQFGALMMPTGMIITEDEAIEFTFDSNAGNSNHRYDLIVCEHVFEQVAGGVEATYFIVKGDNAGSTPVLPNPEKQIIIGMMDVAPGAIAGANLTWNPSSVPLPGDQEIDDLYEEIGVLIPHASTTVDGITQYATDEEAENRVADNVALTPAAAMAMEANTVFRGMIRIATDAEVQNGNPSDVAITASTLLKWGRIRRVTNTNAGDGILVLNNTMNGQVLCLNGDGVTHPIVSIQVPEGLLAGFWVRILCRTQGARVLGLDDVVLYTPNGKEPEIAKNDWMNIEAMNNDVNYMVSGGVLKNSDSLGTVPMRALLDYFPEGGTLDMFDGTGLGISGDVVGYAIANGANGTVDASGRATISYDEAIAEFDTIGEPGGSMTHTLLRTQLPSVGIKLFANEVQAEVGSGNYIGDNPTKSVASGGRGNAAADRDYDLGSSNLSATVGVSENLGDGQSFKILMPYIVSVKIMRIS